MIVADTDVLIDALRGREPGRTRVAREIENASLATTTISLFELLSGAKARPEQEKIERLLGAITMLPFDEPASRAASAARRSLEAEGRVIGMADLQIVGICLSRAMPLLTRNRAHFERVADLVLG